MYLGPKQAAWLTTEPVPSVASERAEGDAGSATLKFMTQGVENIEPVGAQLEAPAVASRRKRRPRGPKKVMTY